MKIVAERLKYLRNGIKLSQAKLAKKIGSSQANINRYETDMSSPPYDVLLRYADFFDVSLDWIFGRTDKPQGELYEFQPNFTEETEEMKRFIEMCFDPESHMNERLKETLIGLLAEAKK